MPAPPKLNQAVIDRYCEALSIGATYEMAASYANVSYSSTNKWRQRGGDIALQLSSLEDDPKAYAAEWRKLDKLDKLKLKFFQKVEETKRTLGMEMLQIIYAAAMGDPAWAEKVLKWKFGDDFRDHRGSSGVEVGVSTSGSKDEDITIRIVYVDEQDRPLIVESQDADKDGENAASASRAERD